MKTRLWVGGVVLAAAAISMGIASSRLHAAPQDDVKIAPSAPMTVFGVNSRPPSNAVLLFTGQPDQISTNFFKRYSKKDGDWTVEAGVATPNKDDLTTKMEFGDCVVHAEYKCGVDANGNSIGEGNSGIGLHGRYEVQIYDSYGHKASPVETGALYSQKAPLVIASKKPGEWHTMDIIFRAPRFDAAGAVTEKPRATVFINGILVQNNEEFNGPTGIQYGEFKGMVKTGPIVIQGDHSPVSFRNVWVAPL